MVREGESLRVYGGVEGADRAADRRAALVEAALDLLTAEGSDAALTVRGVCGHAGLATRYFYESFADRDALAVAVYEHVVSEIATTTLEALAEAGSEDPATMVRVGLANVVRRIAEDPRRGRLLFAPSLANPVLAAQRSRSTTLFADLLGGQAREVYPELDETVLGLVSQFAVGGLAQALTAWLDGTLELSEEALVEHSAELFLALARAHQGTGRDL